MHAQNKGSQDARKKIDALKKAAQKYATACVAYGKLLDEQKPGAPFNPLLNRLAFDRSAALEALAVAALAAHGVSLKHAEGELV